MSNDKVRCTKCGSSNYIKAGRGWRHGLNNIQKRRCTDCGIIYVLPDEHPYALVKEDK